MWRHVSARRGEVLFTMVYAPETQNMSSSRTEGTRPPFLFCGSLDRSEVVAVVQG